MPDQNARPQITAVDFNPDTLFVTFENDMFVTYQAPFIFSVRHEDGNQVITTDANEEEEELRVEIGQPLA